MIKQVVLVGLVLMSTVAAQKKTSSPTAPVVNCECAVQNSNKKDDFSLAVSATSSGGGSVPNAKWQSPINLNPTTKLPMPNSKMSMWLPDSVAGTQKVNGHALYFYPKSSGLNFRLANNGYMYGLLQHHFHHTAETTVGGGFYDLECHLVGARILPMNERPASWCECALNTTASYVYAPRPENKIPGWTELKFGHLAVVAMLFEVGAPNAWFEQAIDPKTGDLYEEKEIPDFKYNGLLALDTMTVTTFEGSLTTGEYTPLLAWNVINNVFQVSPNQLNAYLRALPELHVRPTQPLNKRPMGTATIAQY